MVVKTGMFLRSVCHLRDMSLYIMLHTWKLLFIDNDVEVIVKIEFSEIEFSFIHITSNNIQFI